MKAGNHLIWVAGALAVGVFAGILGQVTGIAPFWRGAIAGILFSSVSRVGGYLTLRAARSGGVGLGALLGAVSGGLAFLAIGWFAGNLHAFWIVPGALGGGLGAWVFGRSEAEFVKFERESQRRQAPPGS